MVFPPALSPTLYQRAYPSGWMVEAALPSLPVERVGTAFMSM